MATMSMNKVIHGAFRRDLRRFVEALGGYDTADRQRAAALGTAWDNFDAQLTEHHEGEHEIAWPAMRAVGVSAQTIAQMDAEHERMAQALAAVRTSMGAFRSSGTPEDAAATRAAMLTLQEVTTEHLDHEESVLEPVYLENEDAPAIKEMGRKFAKVSPVQGGRFFAWVQDGAAPEERAALAETVPGPVLTILTKVFGRGYTRDVAPVWRS